MRRRCSTSMDLWKEKKKTRERKRERITGWNGWRCTRIEPRENKKKKKNRKKERKKRRNGREDPFIGGWRVTMAVGRVIDNGVGRRRGGEKGNGGVPGCRSPGSSLDLHGCGWSSLSPRICTGLPSTPLTPRSPLPPSGDSNLLFGRVLHVGRRNNGENEGGNVGRSAYRSRTTPACRSSPSPPREFPLVDPTREDVRVRWSIFVTIGNRSVSFWEGLEGFLEQVWFGFVRSRDLREKMEEV